MNIRYSFFAVALSCVTAVWGQNGLYFDGADDYVSTTNSGISGSGARTVEAWVNTTANCIPGSGIQQVILDWGASATGARFTFNLLWANSVRLEVGGNGLSGTQAVNDGMWHHVAAVYNPNVSSNQVKLYIDGQLHVQGNLTVPVNTGATVPVQIGKRVDGVNNFMGKIDEVRLWNTARTDAEILANYNHELCGPQTGLMAYYRLNHGTPNGSNSAVATATDETGSYPGTLQNFALNGLVSNWVQGATLPGATSGSATVSACGSYTDPTGTTHTQSGTYSYVLPNATGCDSTVSLALTIDTVDTRVIQNGIVLAAQASAATFQWMDCATQTPISGATSSVYTASANGSYAVVVTDANCSDTSACFTVAGIGLAERSLNFGRISPNPSTGPAALELQGTVPVSATLYTSQGQVLGAWTVRERAELPSNLAPGVYRLRLEAPEGAQVLSWIKL